jgi:hypothetical protein
MNNLIALFILLIFGSGSAVTAAVGEAVMSGRVVITRVMTKKRVTLRSYELRGAALDTQAPDKPRTGSAAVDELSWVVVYLEGRGLPE